MAKDDDNKRSPDDELRMQNAAVWLRQQEHEFPDHYDAGEPVMLLLAAYAKYREQFLKGR